MIQKLKIIGNIIYWTLIVALITIAGLSALSVLGLPSQARLFVVQSGSMEPAIKTGSIAIVRSSNEYKEGDIITYKSSSSADIKNPKFTVTHRIVSIGEQEGTSFYTTKGDANDAPDSTPISKDLILGKVLFSLPYLGYPVGFAKTQTGFITLIVIPATIIVYSELMTIKEEAKRLMKERKHRKLTKKEEIEEKIGEEIMTIEDDVRQIFKKGK